MECKLIMVAVMVMQISLGVADNYGGAVHPTHLLQSGSTGGDDNIGGSDGSSSSSSSSSSSDGSGSSSGNLNFVGGGSNSGLGTINLFGSGFGLGNLGGQGQGSSGQGQGQGSGGQGSSGQGQGQGSSGQGQGQGSSGQGQGQGSGGQGSSGQGQGFGGQGQGFISQGSSGQGQDQLIGGGHVFQGFDQHLHLGLGHFTQGQRSTQTVLKTETRTHTLRVTSTSDVWVTESHIVTLPVTIQVTSWNFVPDQPNTVTSVVRVTTTPVSVHTATVMSNPQRTFVSHFTSFLTTTETISLHTTVTHVYIKHEVHTVPIRKVQELVQKHVATTTRIVTVTITSTTRFY